MFGDRYQVKQLTVLIADEADSMGIDKCQEMFYLSLEFEAFKFLEDLFVHIASIVAAVVCSLNSEEEDDMYLEKYSGLIASSNL
jgi:hypothetical protein